MLDFGGVPRRHFFELAAFFAGDAVHAAKLREFSSAEGQVRKMCKLKTNGNNEVLILAKNNDNAQVFSFKK